MKPTICLLLLVAIQPVYAAGQSNPDAHTHGEGHLTLVYDNGRLLVELTTPAANMLGFEHQPDTEQQWKAVETLSQTLHKPKHVITLDPECEVKDIAVELPFNPPTQYKHSGGEDEHHKGKIYDHNHSGHHDGHQDIYSRYEWYCLNPSLPKLTFNYFNLYSGFETITVEWVVNGSQGITQLNNRENTLEIAQ